MYLRTIAVILAALILAVSADIKLDEIHSGEVLANGYLNILEPIIRDPTQMFFHPTGNEHYGEFNITQRSPATFCIPGAIPAQCGKQAQDTTLLVKVRNGKLSLKSLTNNPTPTPYGQVSEVIVFGSYHDGDVHMSTSTFLEIPRIVNGSTYITRLYTRSVYVGTIKHGRARLEAIGLVVPHLIRPGSAGLDPYQILATYGDIDSSAPYSTIGGYRALSPYGTPASPYAPSSPIYIVGDYHSMQYKDGALRGNINVHSVNYKYNIDNGTLVSDVDLIKGDRDALRVTLGLVRYDGGMAIVDNLHLRSD